MRSTLFASLFLVGAGCAATRTNAQRVRLCGVSFTLPPGWETVRGEYDDPCRLGIRPGDWAHRVSEEEELDLGDRAATVAVADGAVEDVADEFDFTKTNDHWLVMGRGGDAPTEPFASGRWKGMHGVSGFAVRKKDGAYGGLGSTDRIIVGDGRKAVYLVEWWESKDDPINHVLSTLKDDTPPN